MCQRRTCPAALVLDQKKLVAFSVVAGRFLRFPIGDRRCNRTRASVGNAGGNARPSLTSATLAASRLLHGIPPSRSTEKSWPDFRPSAGAVNRHHGIGWEFVHVCIDDASRIAFVQVLTDQRKESAVAFLEAAVAHFAKLGVRIERVMTDNGSCYQSKSFASRNFALCIREHGDKAKSIWTHLDDSASAWSSLLGRRFLPLGSPASAGLFWAPALPKLNRSPSEAPINQSNRWLLIVAGRHLLRFIFVLLQLNLAWRRMRCYGELSRGAACS